MSNERLIKKYANRRLYDSTESRHVTLEDIRKMIVSGAKVKVVDDKSGEDLTRAVLLQVIAEQDQYGTPVLSTELLEAIIRFYGNPVQEMLTKYMEQSVGALGSPARGDARRDDQGPHRSDGAVGRIRAPKHGSMVKDSGFDDVGLCRRHA